MNKTTTCERVNITLPRETIELIDKLSEKRGRSSFLNDAVNFYVKKRGRTNIKRLLKEGALERASRDLEIAAEWFPLEEEAWLKRRK